MALCRGLGYHFNVTNRAMITVNDTSLSTAMVIAMCDDQEAARSTGFVWSHNGANYLVTNWHCLTGVNPFNGRYLSKRFAARPNIVHVALTSTAAECKLGFVVPLFDSQGDPTWLVHPKAGEQVDIAAIELPFETERPAAEPLLAGKPMNEFAWPRFQPFVGDELFVVGYPRNLHMYGLPIWKRATFATEPNLFGDFKGRRQVWIDCASREGMSGSPVVQVRRSHAMRLRGSSDDDRYDDLLSGYSFYGIYSGRLIDPEEDPRIDDQLAAQIGIVWPKTLIEEVVVNGVRDRFRREDVFEPTIEDVAFGSTATLRDTH